MLHVGTSLTTLHCYFEYILHDMHVVANLLLLTTPWPQPDIVFGVADKAILRHMWFKSIVTPVFPLMFLRWICQKKVLKKIFAW